MLLLHALHGLVVLTFPVVRSLFYAAESDRDQEALDYAHSKTLQHHHAAVILHFAFYHFCRIHETLRVTPAMELGLTDHIWSVGELIEQAQACPETPPPVVPQERPRLRLIQGGKVA